MAQTLRVFTALAEDLVQVPAPIPGGSKPTIIPFTGDLTSSGLFGHLLIRDTDQLTPTHKHNKC